MADLITRLEEATGPDRELDAEIFLLQWPGYRLQTDCEPFPDQVQPGRIQEIGGFAHRTAPTYTASIDAALTLVPEGWRSYTADFSIEGRARWWLQGPKTQWRTDDDGYKEPGDDWYAQSIGSTPALAICIAALQARAALSEPMP